MGNCPDTDIDPTLQYLSTLDSAKLKSKRDHYMEFSTPTEEIKLKIRKIIYNFEIITTKMKSFPRTDLSTSLCEARPSSLVSLSRI